MPLYLPPIKNVWQGGGRLVKPAAPPGPGIPARAAYDLSTITGGQILDKTGNGFHLNVVDGVLVSGKFGSGLRTTPITGIGARSVADEPGEGLYTTGSMTVMAWVNATVIGSGSGSERFMYGFTTGDGGNSLFTMWQSRTAFDSGPMPQGNARNSGGSLWSARNAAGSALAVGTWYHTALVFDAAAQTFSYYQDGALVQTRSGFGTALRTEPFTPFYIGGYAYEVATADVSDVRIFHSALSASDVAAFMSVPV